jgi:hypothetical protein
VAPDNDFDLSPFLLVVYLLMGVLTWFVRHDLADDLADLSGFGPRRRRWLHRLIPAMSVGNNMWCLWHLIAYLTGIGQGVP